MRLGVAKGDSWGRWNARRAVSQRRWQSLAFERDLNGTPGGTRLSAVSGDLGFTIGRYVQRRTIGDTESLREGRYITIWRLTADGEWRVALDGGKPDGG